MSSPEIAIVFPAFNEELTIANTISDFHRAIPAGYFVVVDNRSSDNTSRAALAAIKELGCRGEVLSEPRPGKGNAIRKAFREVSADIYVMADADSTYKASDVLRLLEPVQAGTADLVVGNRHANSAYKNQNRRPLHNFGNNLVRKLINFLFRVELLDIMSGYRVMSYRFVKSFPILSEGFELETEMTLHAVDKRMSLLELPIQYDTRPTGSTSKLNTLRDGLRVLKTILWIFKDYRPLPFFSLLSIFCLVLGFGIGIPVVVEFLKIGLVPKFPSAILASGLVISSLLFLVTGLILDTVAKFHRIEFEQRLLRDFPGNFRPERVTE